MTLDEVMAELAAKGSESTKRTLLRHGAVEPFFGVKIGDLKPLQRTLKGQQALALELYATGNSDAMYLAGLVANGALMTPKQLDTWAKQAPWHMIAGCTVPWVAAEHPEAVAIAQRWIDSPHELMATAGWGTLASLVATVADAALPIATLEALLLRCEKTIHQSPNRVRYMMNGYVICVGTYVAPLAEKAILAARAIGKVDVDFGETSCVVPDAEPYILKCRKGAAVAAKRKNTRC